MLINGKWIESDKKIEVVNPYNGDVVGYVSVATPGQVAEATKIAKENIFELSAFDRAKILSNTAKEIEKESNDYALSIIQESGLCIKDAKKEVKRAINLLNVCAEESKRITGKSIYTDITASSQRDIAFTVREPVGLVCAITPFNRPLNQVVVKLGPAIAANNNVVLKPSEKTPLTAIKFIKCLINNGLPDKMVSVVTGDPDEIGDPLVTSPYIDMITFTGSSAIGEQIAKRAGMIKMAFELGDSGALIVMEDADIDKAVKTAVSGAFATAGQSCRGIKRILVHKDVEHAFIERFKKKTAALNLGDPSDPETDIGTLINEAAAIKVENRIKEAVNDGASVVHGGIRKNAQITPTILANVSRNSEIVKKETFGPCAPIIPIDSVEDAINYTNDTQYGLQTGVFTENIKNALLAVKKLRVGAVIINNGPQFDSPNIPFGGVKKSGLGREGIKYAINEMTTVKTIVFA